MKQFYLPVRIVGRDGSPGIVNVRTFTTTEASTDAIIVSDDFDADDSALLVFVSGLLLTPGSDYTPSGNSIVLSAPITHVGTEITFVVIG